MRFFLDANESDAVLPPLQAVFFDHDFSSAAREGLSDVEDVALFHALADRGFHVVITRDFNQLKDPTERAALLTCGLHWIGHRAPDATGQLAVALTAAAYLAALPFFIAAAPGLGAPHSFRVQGVSSLRGQRVKVNPIRP